jgi:hypothetical protein
MDGDGHMFRLEPMRKTVKVHFPLPIYYGIMTPPLVAHEVHYNLASGVRPCSVIQRILTCGDFNSRQLNSLSSCRWSHLSLSSSLFFDDGVSR